MSILIALILFAGLFSVPAPSRSSVYLDAGPGGVTWNGRIYEYGRVAKAYEPFDGDAFLRIRTEEGGDVLNEIVYDGGNDETFIYFAILADDVFAIVTETLGIPGSGGSSLRKTEILTFSAEGGRIGYRSLPGLMAAYNNHGHLLILSEDDDYRPDHVFDAALETAELAVKQVATGSFAYQYRGFATVDGADVDGVFLDAPGIYEVAVSDGAYVFRFLAVVEPVVTGIAADGEYDGAVTIASRGTLFLDGSGIASGTTVSAPGRHELLVAGENGFEKRIAFVIHPYVANVAEGFRTAAGVRIFSNAERLLIDGEPYDAGAMFRIPGNHLLQVLAANGYERTIAFAILPSAAGVEDGGSYEGAVRFSVNGTAVLGGLSVTGEIEVSAPGDHELVLYLDGEPCETIRFSVVAAPREAPWWEAFPFAEVGLGMLAVTGLFLIFRKK